MSALNSTLIVFFLSVAAIVWIVAWVIVRRQKLKQLRSADESPEYLAATREIWKPKDRVT